MHVRLPSILLFVQLPLIVLGLWLFAPYGFSVQEAPDSLGYRQYPLWDPVRALSDFRSFGYPLFLTLIQKSLGNLNILPWLQIAAHLLACVLFWGALRAVEMTPWRRLLLTLPLLYGPLFLHFYPFVLTETLTFTALITVIAALLWTLGRPRSWLAWIALGLATFAAYQIRPAALFVVPFSLVGFALWRWILAPSQEVSWKLWLQRWALCVLAPLLLFVGARWALVGHVGLVSFTGVQLSGVALPMLRADDIPQMPTELQSLAQALFERGQKDQLQFHCAIPDAGPVCPSEHFRQERKPLVNPIGADGQMDFDLWERTIPVWNFRVGYHGALLFLKDRLKVDGALSKLSLAIFQHHPDLYGQWVMGQTQRALGFLFKSWPLLIALIAGIGLWMIAQVKNACGDPPYAVRLLLFWSLLASALFLLGLLLNVLVTFAIPRYVHLYAALLPMPFLLLAHDAWRRLFIK
ncbi:hypothetical protein [Magnetofaba australis]|uniref:Glycosyltransferase RgtA/B/C/D-like domain-containing protein n=1 Tax=Magnetofaba australis IT-1 TaxID=1434232 RepID=A0A1Y2JZP8_9PROT|nr:hypothetical protein [Magnetofaba australis]OSM00378.1 hypothetical protein MAIT1_00883 [Magnetofaba australis IT-1]